jgi:hypothetical protein
MHPMKKVKSRFPLSLNGNQELHSSKTHPVGGKEYRSFLTDNSINVKEDVRHSISFGGFVLDNDSVSPISKINFSQSSIEKVMVVSFLHFVINNVFLLLVGVFMRFIF